MNNYRVLMQDEHNGESFFFAVTMRATDEHWAAALAKQLFPEAKTISSTRKFKEKL